MTETRRILITGAVGQIGSELTLALRNRYGVNNVIASDMRPCPDGMRKDGGVFEQLDVLDRANLAAVYDRHRIDTIVHLAAILSATGEAKPQLCWDVNINGTLNVLELARERGIKRVFIPSSIAAFGPDTPRHNTPQDTILRPRTMYGVTKVAGERLCDYYFHKYNVDVRGLRYPGIISAEALPGGGTTDYAVDIFYKAVESGRYTCFLREDSALPMMYMPDCLKATLDLLEAPLDKLVHHSDFNVGAMSFTPAELAAEIAKHIPGFEITYQPDFRQQIADSWPTAVDDSVARREWGWKPDYDLESMTADMLKRLQARHAAGQLYPA